MKFTRQTVAAIVATSLCLGFVSSATAQRYSVLDLGYVTGTSLNSLGQVAGYRYTDYSTIEAFYTGADGTGLTSLGAPQGSSSAWAYGINDQGQVVGQYTTSTGDAHGFVTGPGGQGASDVSYGSAGSVSLVAINANGQYAGWADQAAITSGPNGTGLQAVNLPGSLGSVVTAINGSGQVLGIAFTNDSGYTFRTGPNGQGISQVGPTFGTGLALNNQGDVVGQVFTDEGEARGFLTLANGATTMLGTLGGNFSRGTGINDQGVIVGTSLQIDAYDSTQTTAFVIPGQGQDMVSLASLANVAADYDGTFAEAIAVNNSGQILVTGYGRSFLLTPTAIPEAQTSAMMLLGLGAIAWGSVRQQRRRPAQA
ncbi:MAG: hypothetical protein Q7V20_12220 [Aquabacterium sp.]|uniref:PEP-CTERM sorting domain-containing protein n=1 Tax=Aquabacterium sp. TaxID=1872578 RepID=UPI002724F441|nr:PEP-CTERM sorting domain-containing protein [Aquabacterium sp.]MDO9004210.1 hypothetical protein [Aquabacterium sp.]